MAALWCEVLQREQIGLNDNFFEAGGGSIQIVLLHRRIEEIFKVTVPIAELFRLTTVKRIAGYLQAMQDNARAVNQTQQRHELPVPRRAQRCGIRNGASHRMQHFGPQSDPEQRPQSHYAEQRL